MALWTVSVESIFKAWGCRPTPRRADARSTAFSPLNPPGDFGPTPVAPARGEAGGMVCMALLRILIGQQMVVVRLHGNFEYTSCLYDDPIGRDLQCYPFQKELETQVRGDFQSALVVRTDLPAGAFAHQLGALVSNRTACTVVTFWAIFENLPPRVGFPTVSDNTDLKTVPTTESNTRLGGDNSSQLEFTRLFVASQAAFQGFLLTLVHDRHAADDLVQELACRLWLKFGDYERSRPFVAWGLGFARLLAFEWRRLQARLPVPLDEPTLQALADVAAERSLASDDRHEALGHCLQYLTDHQRQVLQARYYRDQAVADIARQAQRTEMAVYKVLKRAHQMLLDCMRKTLASPTPP